MRISSLIALSLPFLPPTSAYEDESVLNAKWATDWTFTGLTTFAHLPSQKCLVDFSATFDIALIGVPFDTSVSYRPGARFGPRAIRAASMRQNPMRGFNARAGFNPYDNWADIIDCMDMPITPVDNKLALYQMTDGFKNLLAHNTTNPEFGRIPRLIALGGDHSIILSHLRALYELYGKVSVIHFDAHLDTWLPNKFPSGWEDQFGSGMGQYTHGSMFWMAAEEGLMSDTCIHAGLRTRLSGVDYSDYKDDSEQGFKRITCDDIDDFGAQGIIDQIHRVIPKDAPVYISVDVDVIDPSAAPGTGTPEVGGWTTRELIRLLRGMGDFNIVGADVVEVSPAYDQSENTALAGAQIAFEILTSMVMHRADSGIHDDPSRAEMKLPPASYPKLKYQDAETEKRDL